MNLQDMALVTHLRTYFYMHYFYSILEWGIRLQSLKVFLKHPVNSVSFGQMIN